MNEGIYYLRVNGKVEGPFTIGQIYDLWAARKINSQTPFARFEEMEKWQPLSELTLKISAPKTTPPKTAAPEPSSAPPAKPRLQPSVTLEEYIPPLRYPVEPKPREPGDDRRAAAPSLKRIFSDFSVSIGFCLAAGVILAIYFMLFFSASSDGKEIDQNSLAMKQNGVIVGIGLILMGGLLIVARQITQLIGALKAPTAARPEQKPDALSQL